MQVEKLKITSYSQGKEEIVYPSKKKKKKG